MFRLRRVLFCKDSFTEIADEGGVAVGIDQVADAVAGLGEGMEVDEVGICGGDAAAHLTGDKVVGLAVNQQDGDLRGADRVKGAGGTGRKTADTGRNPAMLYNVGAISN